MRLLRLAWQGFRQDLFAGRLLTLMLAVCIAVAAITTVGFFTDRLKRALEFQAGELIGGDLRLSSRDPLPQNWTDEARNRGLRTARLAVFPSVVVSGDRTLLVSLKAVSEHYPLRGVTLVSNDLDGPGEARHEAPLPGQVWVEPRLLYQLGLRIGDQISVGRNEFQITQVIRAEPDRDVNFFAAGPRVILAYSDLADTGLIHPASRIRYRQVFAGAPERIQPFKAWLGDRLDSGQELHDGRNARPRLSQVLQRAERFLALAALVSVLIGGAAISLAARHHAIRQADSTAILRCLGASQALVFGIHALGLLWAGLLASLVGLALGYAGQATISWMLADLTTTQLPPPGAVPALAGLLTGLVTLFGFALPPLLKLRAVPPLRVLRRDLGLPTPSSRSVLLLGLVTFALLVIWHAADLKLAAYMLTGTLATLALLGGGALGLLHLVSRLPRRLGHAWRFGLSNVLRRGGSSAAQVLAFGLGIMVLLLLALIRSDLLTQWQQELPAETPDHFLINIQPQEVDGVRQHLRAMGVDDPILYPMVRGRWNRHNGDPVDADAYQTPRANRLASRAFNLSWAQDLPSDNGLSAGRWWSDSDKAALISVEEGLAETLGIRIGDRLGFDVAGEPVEAEVVSLRRVDWGNFRANFFVLFNPGTLEDYPASYITSFRIQEATRPQLADLVRAFPSVTVLDIGAILRQAERVITRISEAMQLVFLFTLLAGLAVLLTAIHTTLDERRRETALLRSLGAHRGQVRRGLMVEFGALGLTAGLLGTIAAQAIGLIVARQLLDLDYRPDPWLWLVGPLLATLGIMLAGLLGTRSLLNHPPVASLRQG